MSETINPTMALQCGLCAERPPVEATLEEWAIGHVRLAHPDVDTDDGIRMELVAVCTCGKAMTFTATSTIPRSFDVLDHFVCLDDFNRGGVRRTPKP